ncbi:MAG TPA: ECF-type sigma factor, partial [Polyangiaceae bacterium]|nr:ECF-type sigma factor [Polyangiaceae bacterium]
MKRDATPPSPPAAAPPAAAPTTAASTTAAPTTAASTTAAPPGADAPAGEEVEALFGSSYEQLRALARARLGRGPRDALLDTTALVHESFERIARAAPQARAADRGRFFRYAGHVMRSVIVDAVRARVAERRGGDAPHEPLDLSRLGDSF